MKGRLYKTDTGWGVRYTQEDPRDPLPELPLHPEYVKYYFLDEDAEGEEVEFDWCVIVDHDTGKGKEYAKLKRPKEQTNGERFDEFMRTIESYPELEGTMNLCNDIIKKKTGKMTEEEWQAAENNLKPKYTPGSGISFYIANEISDEEIEEAWEDFRIENPNTVGGFKDQYKSFLYGIKWYREQLKKKQ